MILSCSDNSTSSSKEVDNSVGQHIIIDIQPFNDVPKEYVKYIYNNLTKVYGLVEIKKPIKLPQSAYYSKRNRYRADTLINFLKTNTPKGHVTLAITTKDISHTKGNIIDYGLMGLGFKPGSSCVISTFRLNKKNLLEQSFRLSIHELGHTQGLPHCPDTTCLMRDAKGKNHWNNLSQFCDNCKNTLTEKGWTFKD